MLGKLRKSHSICPRIANGPHVTAITPGGNILVSGPCSCSGSSDAEPIPYRSLRPRDLVAHRPAFFWRPRRADRRHASHPRRGKALDRRKRSLHALSYCMLLPGPEAQQLATYVGWPLHGTRGGLVAGPLSVLPGFLAIMALSIPYVMWQQHPLLAGVFLGSRPRSSRWSSRRCCALENVRSRVAPPGGWRRLHSWPSRSPTCPSRSSCSARALRVTCASAGLGLFPPPCAPAGTAGADSGLDAGHSPRPGLPRPAASNCSRLAATVVSPFLLCTRLLEASTRVRTRRVLQPDGRGHFRGAYAVLTYVAQQAVERSPGSPRANARRPGARGSTPGPSSWSCSSSDFSRPIKPQAA